MIRSLFRTITLFCLITTIIGINLLNYRRYDQVSSFKFQVPSIEQKEITLNYFVKRKIDKLNDNQKRGTFFITSIPDTTLSDETVAFLNDYHISGIILMGNNIVDEAQVKQLTKDLKEKVDPRILIAIDQEGGTVKRIDWDEYANVNARSIGSNEQKATEVAISRAKLLRALGINTNFAPVADLAGSNSYMYYRSFSNNPEEVASTTKIFIQESQKQGLFSTMKHFPGLSGSIDPHETTPTINKSVEELKGFEWIPYKKAIENNVEFIMLSNIYNPNIDLNSPCNTSKKCYQELETLGFEGIVITDDLKMAKGQGNINWGLNLIIDNKENIVNRIGSIEPDEEYLEEILEFKYKRL